MRSAIASHKGGVVQIGTSHFPPLSGIAAMPNTRHEPTVAGQHVELGRMKSDGVQTASATGDSEPQLRKNVPVLHDAVEDVDR